MMSFSKPSRQQNIVTATTCRITPMEHARFWVILMSGFLGAILSIIEGQHGAAILGSAVMILANSRR